MEFVQFGLIIAVAGLGFYALVREWGVSCVSEEESTHHNLIFPH